MIPLIDFSAPPASTGGGFEKTWLPPGTFSQFNLLEPESIPEGCYGVTIRDASTAPILKPGMIGLFAYRDLSLPPLNNIYAVGLSDGPPLIRKVIKNETGAESVAASPGEANVRRKSFMTPTPLHIPGSRVSPIPQSTHRVAILQRLDRPEKPEIVPGGRLAWMHPLVRALNEHEFELAPPPG